MKWPWRKAKAPDTAFVLIDFLDADGRWIDCAAKPLDWWTAKGYVQLPPGTTQLLLQRTDGTGLP